MSKLWCTYHEKERVAQACKKSLQDWRLDYFDLYLVHFPVALKYVDFAVKYPPELEDEFGAVLPFGSATNQETWTAMEALVDVGLARSIGVSNYNSQSIMDLLRYARIQPATLQIEHHPYLAQERLVKYATEQGIQITAYSSFGPASFMELQFKMAQKCGPLLEDGGVKTIAQRHGKTSAQVLLRWATQRGVAVIPKSNHLTRLKENLDCCTFDLEEGDMEYLNGLDRGLRFNDFVHVSPSCFPLVLSREGWLGEWCWAEVDMNCLKLT